jgi:hypothetical protein
MLHPGLFTKKSPRDFYIFSRLDTGKSAEYTMLFTLKTFGFVALYQGTTSVVPQRPKRSWALQAAEKLCFRVGRGFIPGINVM